MPGGAGPKYLLGDFGGERSKLADEGFTFTPSYTAETFGNPTGGVRQGVIYEGLLDLELTLNLKKWPIGTARSTSVPTIPWATASPGAIRTTFST